jgi:hypothetical protein
MPSCVTRLGGIIRWLRSTITLLLHWLSCVSHLYVSLTLSPPFISRSITDRERQIDLSTEIKYRLQHNSPTGTAWIAPFIDSHLDPWKAKWLMPGQGEQLRDRVHPLSRLTCADLPLPVQHSYLLLIHRHGRLWLLSTGLDARYGSPEDRQACISDCLQSALACCKLGLDDLYTPSYLWVSSFLFLQGHWADFSHYSTSPTRPSSCWLIRRA